MNSKIFYLYNSAGSCNNCLYCTFSFLKNGAGFLKREIIHFKRNQKKTYKLVFEL